MLTVSSMWVDILALDVDRDGKQIRRSSEQTYEAVRDILYFPRLKRAFKQAYPRGQAGKNQHSLGICKGAALSVSFSEQAFGTAGYRIALSNPHMPYCPSRPWSVEEAVKVQNRLPSLRGSFSYHVCAAFEGEEEEVARAASIQIDNLRSGRSWSHGLV